MQPLPSPAAPLPVLTEEQRRARLERMRRLATGLLILMAVVFLALEVWRNYLPAWTRYVAAFAEAAMVGALADWFAVTALFRRPLGLPIPHTAIIPEKKTRIGESLGRFVQTNFLAPDVIQHRLDQIDVATRLEAWLAEPANVQMLAQRISNLLPPLLDKLDDDAMEDLIGRNVEAQVAKLDLAPIASQLLTALTAQNKHQEILDQMLRWAERQFDQRKPDIRVLIRKESPWYLRLVDRPLFEKLVETVERTLTEINQDPQHPLRQEVSTWLANLIEELRTSPELHARLEAAKTDILAHPSVRGYFSRLWALIRTRLREDVEAGQMQTRIEQVLQSLGKRLLKDEALREQINRAFRNAAAQVVEAQRDNVGRLIGETVQRWETPVLVDRLELMVGRDLQFIRINGTLVGGAVGVLLYILRLWLA